MSQFGRAMGWLPDYPDFRDYTEGTPRIHEIMRPRRLRRRPKGETLAAVKAEALPPSVDLKERIEGGHAVVAVGYDDGMKIKNRYDGRETTGALLIRNSWGKGWGEGGYGYLPYEYVLAGLAEDFWSVLKKEWVDTGAFGE